MRELVTMRGHSSFCQEVKHLLIAEKRFIRLCAQRWMVRIRFFQDCASQVSVDDVGLPYDVCPVALVDQGQVPGRRARKSQQLPFAALVASDEPTRGAAVLSAAEATLAAWVELLASLAPLSRRLPTLA